MKRALVLCLMPILFAVGCGTEGDLAGGDTQADALKNKTQTIDIGCLDLQNFNNNTHYADLGTRITLLFEICDPLASWQRVVGVHAYAWKKRFDITVTDPDGNTYGVDPKWSGASGGSYSLAPAMQGQYSAEIFASGGGRFVFGVAVDTFGS